MDSHNNMSADELQALRMQLMHGNNASPPQQPSHQMYQQPMQQDTQQSVPYQQQAPVQPMSQPTPQPMPQQPQQQTASQVMAARMAQARQQQAQQTQNPTVMQQGMNYQPGQSAQPINQQSANNQQGTVSNQTIINSTNRGGARQNLNQGSGADLVNDGAGEDSGSQKKGFKFNPIMAVGAVIVVLIAGFFIFSSLNKPDDGTTDGDVAQATTDPNGFVDPFADPNTEWIVPDQQWAYTDEQVAQLRAAGYTGDEIEKYATQMTPYDDLIRQANAARDAYIQEAIAPLLDTASDEYKALISQTWLPLKERPDVEEWYMTSMQYQERKNLDYEKIDVYGNQLFIKVYLSDSNHDDWFYVCVTPEEYMRLGESGNIIVNYTYSTRQVGDDPMTSYEDTENICITNASIEFVE